MAYSAFFSTTNKAIETRDISLFSQDLLNSAKSFCFLIQLKIFKGGGHFQIPHFSALEKICHKNCSVKDRNLF